MINIVGSVRFWGTETYFRLLARLCQTGLVTRRVPIKGFTFEMILLFRASSRDVWDPLGSMSVCHPSAIPALRIALPRCAHVL